MTQPIPLVVRENWDASLVAILSEMAPQERVAAEEWWRLQAPAIYQMLLEALPYEGDGYPDDWRDWDLDMLEGDVGALMGIPENERGNRAARYAAGAAIGLLIFYSLRRNKYVNQRGVDIPQPTVRGMMYRTIGSSRPTIHMLTERLRSGAISPEEWRRAMADEVKRLHWTAGLMGFGGRNNMPAWKVALIEESIAVQLRYLQRRYEAILSGEQLLDGTILRRAMMYLESAAGMYFDAEMLSLQDRFDMYRNILTAKESCEGPGSCVEETGKDWVPIGTLIPIGNRICVSNCRCYFEYKNSTTGEVR